MRLPAILLFLLVFQTFIAPAQYSFKAVVKDKETHATLPGVIAANGRGNGAASNDSGLVVVTGLRAGRDTFHFSYPGYKKATVIVDLPDNSLHVVEMTGESLQEVIVVASTRTNERIENAPTKVEVLGKEEMDEENSIRPANIASLIGDVSGVQIQQSSAVSGNANVRIQGLGGQYTQILRDGMPLYEGFSGGFGILQIPPLDLQQAELIKGSASTLYGGGAIAGLINLITRRPTLNQEAVITLNATTLQEEDVNAFFAKRNKHTGYTFFAGYLHQNAVDVNKDFFSDVPDLNSFTVHPRFFYYPDDKTSLMLGYNGTYEKRIGGDLQVITHFPDSLHQYFEKDITQRHTGELILERNISPGKLTAKGSLSDFNRTTQTNLEDIKARQLNYYAEVSALILQKNNSLVGGLNVTGSAFKKLPGSDSIPLNNYDNSALGAFVQYTLHIGTQTTLEGGLRGDHTAHWGDFFLPRIALFHRFNEEWAMRAGAGLGYKVPDPLEVQIIDYPIEDLQPLPPGIKAERSAGYNLEGNFKKELGKDVNLFINHAFFLTRITDPILSTQLPDGRVFFSNAPGSNPVLNTQGFDTYVKLTVRELELYFGYTYTDAERKYLPSGKFVTYTPRNRFAFTALRPFAEKWRIGIEGSYVGKQYRDGDSDTPPYFFAAMMVARDFSKLITVVLNCENLFDYRQTRYEQIYTGPVQNPTFKTLWAPIDGRVINLSVRITPFKK